MVEITDVVIWAKHVHDKSLRDRITQALPGTIIPLKIAGRATHWIKMNDDPSGRPTDGIRAAQTSSKLWREIRKQFHGTLVSIQFAG